MNPEDIQRFVENHRVAAARVAADARERRMSASEAFEASLALLRLDEELNGSPFDREDPVTRREDLEMWEAWARLRVRWGRER